MNSIRAIPVTYSGVRFRSRTEARWAVFFDHLKIRWEYEREGYQLASGWYVPDFWLPDVVVSTDEYPDSVGCWLEIKGRTSTPGERLAILELREATGAAAALAIGCPTDCLGFDCGGIWLLPLRSKRFMTASFARCYRCERRYNPETRLASNHSDATLWCSPNDDKPMFSFESSDILKAEDAARTRRFW